MAEVRFSDGVEGESVHLGRECHRWPHLSSTILHHLKISESSVDNGTGLMQSHDMRNGKRLSELEISALIRAKKPFILQTNRERIDALRCSKFLGVGIQTKERNEGGYSITFTV